MIIIAFSPVPTFDVRLPAGDDLQLVVHIRDTLNCITEYNISSVTVLPDLTSGLDLINTFRRSPDETINNELIQLMSTGNQNKIAQVISLFSSLLNQMTDRTIDEAVSSK